MATKVLDLELTQLPMLISELEAYQNVFAVFRYNSKPVGFVWFPISEGYLSKNDLQKAARQVGGESLWQQLLYDYLDWHPDQPVKSVPPRVTVAVCTRDRTEDLQRCLDAFLKIPDIGQEYLVVDNCPSTEETRLLVQSYNGRINYIRENRPGLNSARNRALVEAEHDIVVFNDDDAMPEQNWLENLVRNFSDQRTMCVTGLTLPVELETEAQEWFERIVPFNRGFIRRVFDINSISPLAAGHVGAGVNMALRRSVVREVGKFDEALDAGTPTQSGGETEMFSRILAAGHRIVYDPAAVSWHRHRRTWKELQKVIYGYGVGVYAVWTKQLIREQEFDIPSLAWQWFRYDQMPQLIRALRRHPDHKPLDLVVAEIQGCFLGPISYLRSSWQQRRQKFS